MVKAEITVGTCYGDVVIPVEVLGKGPRPGTAWVRALNGLEPFTKISHGGPFQDSTSIVLIPHLREVHIEKDPDESIEEELLQEDGIEVQLPISEKRIPVEDRNIPVEDWFLESAYEDRTFIE
ncbi:hypothetical protein [Leptolinea tardivitalis]|jgi:hypothetical protein|uniref:Uncharacterized protein n=1 Tax=Leptolinea tardivitalis TaxID=229920 RepID=A0A0P6WWA9_9CHLR|nr:hypothetical protein [Leptolinea tardivitalis]KPL70325.1 hypothetical protein ADM99_14295 [Leptolinea tardivitalis]GAP21887.1 hypothetical protein LTAR_02105 [Leptolinea tardivitalis]